MEIVAKAKMMRISAVKVRIVGDLIKKKNVNDALGILQFTREKAPLSSRNCSIPPSGTRGRRNTWTWTRST